MKNNRLFILLGLAGVILVAAGGSIYAITREFSAIPISLTWAGLLSLLIFAYTNFSEIRGVFSRRSTKHGANMSVMIIIFLVIIGMVGAMSVRYKVRVDLTETGRYSLSPQTVKILRSLENDVEAVAFYRSDERTRQSMVDLLKEYSYYSPNFKFWFVDPDKRPVETAKYGVTSYRTTLIRSGGKQEIVGFESEEKVTNALLKVIKDEVKSIYFLKGHGENGLEDDQKTGYMLAKQAIEKENHKVQELLLVSEEQVPNDAAILVIAGPKADILPSELEKITRYVENGGSVLFLLDPGRTPEISRFLKDHGFSVGNDIIIDKQSQMIGANYLTPVAMEYNQKHAIGRDFDFVTFFPVARSVEVKENPAKGSFNLAKTGSSSWAKSKGRLDDDEVKFDPANDQRGPINLAAVAVFKVKESEAALATAKETSVATQETPDGKLKEGENRWGKIIVVGDSDFAGNAHLKLMGNKDFFLNLVSWLAEEASLISVRKKETGLTPLTLTDTQGNLVFWLSVIIGPSLALAIGVGVVARRRRAT